jgi:4-amino-4-deoxy-L-arabinose transferase-like glycosyltransferase
MRPAALTAVLVVSAWLRLSHLDLVEFKSDEALICKITADMLDQGRPATHGLVSGTGLTNSPMFAYLLLLPAAISRDPAFLTAVIAIANVAAIGLVYLFASRRWGLGVGWWAALLMGTAPWAVIYSRKIWAQDVLPIMTVCALFGLLRLLDGEKKRILAVFLLAGVATMTHLSGACAVITIIVCLAVYRPQLSWKRLGVACSALLLLSSPYLVYQARHGASDRELAGRYLKGGITPRRLQPSLADIAGTGLNIVNDFGMERMLGTPPSERTPKVGSRRPGSVLGRAVTVLAVVALLVQLVRRVRRRARGDDRPSRLSRRDYTVLALWLLVPVALYWLAGIRVYTHYFIITLPVPFVAVALLLEDARRAAGRLRGALVRNLAQAVPIAVGLAMAGSGLLSTWQLHQYLDRNGGAPGSYGVALRHKAAAVEHIVAEAGHRPAALVGDTARRTPLPGAEEFEYLLRLEQQRRGPATGTPRDFVIIDRYRYNLGPAELEYVATLSPKHFGPLLVCALPERDRTGGGPTPPTERTEP